MPEIPPAVAAVLDVTPVGRKGEVLTGWHVRRDQRGEDLSMPLYGDPEPIAARQAVAVLRWAVDEINRTAWSPEDGWRPLSGVVKHFRAEADAIEAHYRTEGDAHDRR